MKNTILVICFGCFFVLAGCGSEKESDQAFESRINHMVEAAEKAENKEAAYREVMEALEERNRSQDKGEDESCMKGEGEFQSKSGISCLSNI